MQLLLAESDSFCYALVSYFKGLRLYHLGFICNGADSLLFED